MKKTVFKEITLANAFLCFCVIMIHLTSSPLSAYTPGSILHGILFFINKVLCFSVPGFLFLSGFKLWSKYGGDHISIKEFFLGRLMKILLPYVLSVAVYFLYFFRLGWVETGDLPEYFLLGTLVAHFYYVIIAVQLYLLFPILNYLVKKFPTATVAVSFISTVVFSGFVHFTYSDRFFGSYIFYFILGMLFAKYRPFERFKALGIISIIGSLVSGAVHLGYLYFSAMGQVTYENEALVNILYVTLAVMAILYVFSRLNNRLQPLHRFAKVIGGASYDIYLYHILGIFILQYDVYPRLSLSVTEKFIISTVLVFGIAVAYSYLRRMITEKCKIIRAI